MDMNDGSAGVVAVVRALDDLPGLLGQIGVLSLALEVAGLGDREDDLSFLISHGRISFIIRFVI